MNSSRWILYAALLSTVSACARTLNVLDNVQLGQTEEQAIRAVDETANSVPRWIFENAGTTYLVYGFIATLIDTYDNTITYYFVRLENDIVVEKGIVSERHRDEIKLIDPNFDTDELIRRARN